MTTGYTGGTPTGGTPTGGTPTAPQPNRRPKPGRTFRSCAERPLDKASGVNGQGFLQEAKGSKSHSLAHLGGVPKTSRGRGLAAHRWSTDVKTPRYRRPEERSLCTLVSEGGDVHRTVYVYVHVYVHCVRARVRVRLCADTRTQTSDYSTLALE